MAWEDPASPEWTVDAQAVHLRDFLVALSLSLRGQSL